MRRVLLCLLLLTACGDHGSDAPPPLPTVDVPASGETQTGEDAGDPDDPAIWRNAADPAGSAIITTDKTFGLRVFDLDGRLLAEYPDGEMNNVDVRGDVVAATDRSDDTIAVYAIADRVLAPERRIVTGVTVYGFCLGRLDGRLYAYVTTKGGVVVQFDLATGAELRRVDVGTQLEGCVVDDESGTLFVGEEDVGVWKLPAAPDGDAAPEAVDRVGEGRLVADVEGLALFHEAGGGGYLLVSSQGDSSYVLYERAAPHAFVGRFHIRGGALDPATETDGLEVAGDLGGAYAEGLLVVQDDQNAGFTRCFKLVKWADVVTALGI